MKKSFKKTLLGASFVGAVVAAGTFVSAPKASAATSTPVYRLYNPNTGEHFYTQSGTERNADIAAGWNNEGIGWNAPTAGTPVYRVYNPNAKGGDHYYTKSKAEASSLVNVGWKWDNGAKPVFYSGGNTPIYVAYNPNAQSGAHNFTGNLTEENSLINAGWKYKAVAWNAVGLATPSKSTPNISTNPTLVAFAQAMQQGMQSNVTGNPFTAVSVIAQDSNTISIAYTMNTNMGTMPSNDLQSFKVELASTFDDTLGQMKQMGINNPQIKFIFKNADGSIAGQVTFP
jgi:hypothetical protein